MYVTKIMLLALLEKTLWYKISMILMEIFLMMTILEAFSVQDLTGQPQYFTQNNSFFYFIVLHL